MRGGKRQQEGPTFPFPAPALRALGIPLLERGCMILTSCILVTTMPGAVELSATSRADRAGGTMPAGPGPALLVWPARASPRASTSGERRMSEHASLAPGKPAREAALQGLLSQAIL